MQPIASRSRSSDSASTQDAIETVSASTIAAVVGVVALIGDQERALEQRERKRAQGDANAEMKFSVFLASKERSVHVIRDLAQEQRFGVIFLSARSCDHGSNRTTA